MWYTRRGLLQDIKSELGLEILKGFERQSERGDFQMSFGGMG